MHELDADVTIEEFGGHMRRRPEPAGAENDLAWIGFCHRDHIGARMGGERWIDDEHQRRCAGQRAAGKILFGI